MRYLRLRTESSSTIYERSVIRLTIAGPPRGSPLTNAQRDELDRRLDELDREGPTGIPWEEVFRNIRSRR
ncbi:MAG: addiction module protein [Acidobacteriia bacterium]|nr:addiction module protein [Terriglobia bacterium]